MRILITGGACFIGSYLFVNIDTILNLFLDHSVKQTNGI